MTADVQRELARDVLHAMATTAAVYHEGIVARAIADAEKRAYSKGWNQATEVAATGLRYEAGIAGGGAPT